MTNEEFLDNRLAWFALAKNRANTRIFGNIDIGKLDEFTIDDFGRISFLMYVNYPRQCAYITNISEPNGY